MFNAEEKRENMTNADERTRKYCFGSNFNRK